MKRTLAILIALLVVLGLGTPLVAAQQSNNPDIADDGEILSCTTITEPGEYYLGSDLQGSSNDACITVAHNASTVTINGNGHTLQGPGEGSIHAIKVDPSYNAGRVEIHDITISGWDHAIEHSDGKLSFYEATVTGNSIGYNANVMDGGDIWSVEFRNNEGTAINTGTIMSLSLRNVQATNNGAGLAMIDGGSVRVMNSEFNNNENFGISVGHSMNASFTNVQVSGNGGPGVGFSGSSMGTKASFEDSTITNNGLDGIAVHFQPDSDHIDLTNVHIDGNERRAITAYEPERDAALARVNATNVTLGGGLTVNFEQEAPILETTTTDWSATDTIKVAGEDTVTVEATFDVGGETGQLWKESNGGWSKQAEFSTNEGRFTETLGTGHWTGVTAEQTTPTPTPTPEPTPEPTPTATATPTEPAEPTDTPTETDSGTVPAGTDPPTATPDDSTPESGVGSGGGGSGAESRPDTPTETATRDDDSTPSNGETFTPTDTEAATTTETEQVTESPAGTQVTTENQSDAGTPNDGSSSEDLPGFTGVLALIALVGATLLAYRNAETQ